MSEIVSFFGPEIRKRGLKDAHWRSFAVQIMPIRNRLAHMRALRPEAKSADRARKWKRDHELAVRKLTGVDAAGRLLDDRGLDAVTDLRSDRPCTPH